MNNLHDNAFFMAAVKYFTFKQPTTDIKRLFYRNAIYEGEVVTSSIDKNTQLAHGLGVLITNQAVCYFGRFEDGELNGEGNCFFNDGSFLRGSFKDGTANGNFIYSLHNGDIYMMTFNRGALTSNCTYFPYNNPVAFMLNFEKNRFKEVIRSYAFPSEDYYKAKIEIIREFFEESQMKDHLLNEKDLHSQMKRLKQERLYIGCYEIGHNEFIYSGVFDSKLDFCGLGVLIKNGNRIEIGNFKDAKLEILGIIFDKGYMYFGFFEQGDLNGNVVVKSLKKDAFKFCKYNMDSFEGVINEGTGMPIRPLFEFNSSEQIVKFLELPEDKADITFYDENIILDFFEQFKSDYQNELDRVIKQKMTFEKDSQPSNPAVIKNMDQKFTFRASSRLPDRTPKKNAGERSFSQQIQDPSSFGVKQSLTRLTLKLKEADVADISAPLPRMYSKFKAPPNKWDHGNKKSVTLRIDTNESQNISQSKKAMILTGELQTKLGQLNDKNDMHKNICWDFDDNYSKKKQHILENHFQFAQKNEKNFVKP